MNDKAKKVLLCFLFAVLFLPLLQNSFSFVQSAPLNGYHHDAPDPSFTYTRWFDGSYWDEKSKYINDHTGFRADMVRLNNQLDYSLFRKIRVGWKLIGDDSCLMQDTYVYSYLGRDYDGYGYVAEKVRKLKAIQDTLAKAGKSLILVYAPSKAYYYLEHFPQYLKDTVTGTTNFDMYKRIGDSLGLNQVDFNSWLVNMKPTSKELLYPRQGFHWSTYASLLAADSLARYMERLRHIHLIHPVWDKVDRTTKPRGKDDDIAKSMNLIVPFTTETFSYPEVQFKGDKTTTKPNIIFVGDSFLFQWIYSGVMDNTYSNWQIWYYYRELINKQYDDEASPPLTDDYITSQLGKADCIVIMFTGPNLHNMGNDFVEKTYAYYYPLTSPNM